MSFRLGVVAMIVGIGAASASSVAGQAPPAAKAGGPLTARVSCDVTGATPILRAQIANGSGGNAALVLGFTPSDNAQTHVVTAVTVVTIRPATGADEEFLYVNPKYAAFTGRSEPWVVSLTPGKTFDVELPVRDFISRMNYVPLDPAAAGGARLVIDAKAAKTATGVYVGKFETVVDSCR